MIRPVALVFGLAILSAQVDAQTDPALRQRCYAIGVMHADDKADPALFGMPASGECRQSFDAGKAYFQRVQHEAKDALRRAVDDLAAECRHEREMLAREEHAGRGSGQVAEQIRFSLQLSCNDQPQ